MTKNETKLRQLRRRLRFQGVKKFILPATFHGGLEAPFAVYTYEWAGEHHIEGIDDQVTWLKEARGGTIAPEIGGAFRELYRLARSNDVPFGDLCVYALGFATPGGKHINGKLFDASGAILLMKTGSYESIRDLLGQKPELRAEVISLGNELLDNGATPDLQMLKKLQDIIARYMRGREEGG